ncbi:DUF7541 family protein [Halorientalis litorea]|jgi:hypothetical protein|uniref:DUF7541 family protein n=1 Tax=Halorientalis litorea TaxID=2931977 RepID=UPI001FF5FA01|nr:cox cluster protein [Halorientalis litorea]
MDEDPGLSAQYRRASPWPVFVAVGLALSEVGIIVGIFAIAVGGLLLFAGSVAGILNESGYTAGLWWPLVGFGIALSAIGGGLVVSEVGFAFDVMAAAVASPGTAGTLVPRALAIALAGAILLVAGGTGRALDTSVVEA